MFIQKTYHANTAMAFEVKLNLAGEMALQIYICNILHTHFIAVWPKQVAIWDNKKTKVEKSQSGQRSVGFVICMEQLRR